MRVDFRSLTSIAAATLALLGASAMAQPAPLAQPGPAPLVDAQTATPVATGRIQQWLLNPNGEVDGLLLADGTQVGFPPHLSANVLQNFKPGDNVQVTGWRAPNLPVVRATSLIAPSGGQRVIDQPPSIGSPPPAPRDPSALTAMTASGKVSRVLYTDRGDANGVLLDNGSIVRFPPHIGAALAPTLQPGSKLSARGWGSRSALGSAMEATALGPTAESMQELFAGPGLEPAPPRGPYGPRGPRGPAGEQPPRPLPPGLGQPVPPVPPAPAS